MPDPKYKLVELKDPKSKRERTNYSTPQKCSRIANF